MISEYFDIKMLEHFQKAAAKSNETDERLKHCPRATKYSTNKFYNFKNKRKGARKKMKHCVYFKNTKRGYALRCLRDGSLRKTCYDCRCPHFKPTFLYKLFNGGWKGEKRTYKH